jgi:hypothetical protein
MFELTELFLAMAVKDISDRHACSGLDERIGLDEIQLKSCCQSPTNRRLARTHEADKADTISPHRSTSPSTRGA